ncbi:EamA family transporter [Streptomyces sp. 3MP-14]|uniref:EamA family transporter n=1 Tax=Streptomyces mimosae TaxID=2586635 RepID=A0A5N6AQW6_9ACTN|nr:EamA family transporter [Streptomyces mimosae]KAB8179645.1 EamA family transporter [Streptomyces sp. 3MP-14]
MGRSAVLSARSTSRSGTPWAAFLAIVAAALIWSTSFAVTKVVLENVPPMTIGAIRFTAAALILAFLVRLQKGWQPVDRRAALTMGGAGLLGITAYFGLENIGVDLATAADAAVIVAAFPMITVILEVAVNREWPTLPRVAGMVLAMAGVWLIVQQSASEGGTNRLLGDILLLVAGVAWAAYNVVARRTSGGHSPLTVTYYQTVAGALGFVLLSTVEVGEWSAPDPADWGMLAFLAGACSIAAFVLYNYGLRDVTSSTAVNILNLVPVFGLVSAVVVTGESVGLTEAVGCLVVIAGVVLGAGGRSRPARRAAEAAGPAEGRRDPDHLTAKNPELETK